MDKASRKRLGAWISLLGGGTFVLGALAAIYVAFFMPAETRLNVLMFLGRLFHK